MPIWTRLSLSSATFLPERVLYSGNRLLSYADVYAQSVIWLLGLSQVAVLNAILSYRPWLRGE